MRFAKLEPGDTLYSGTGAIPVAGEALDLDGLGRVANLESYADERPLSVCEIEGGLDPHSELTVRSLDLRGEMCSLWWPMVAPMGVDDNDYDIAYLDQGGGRTLVRNQVGYSRRPDGLYASRAASTTAAGLRYGSFRNLGLHIDGGAEHTLLNSTFSQWGGGAPTSWARAVTGAATANQDTTRYLCDVAGLRSSLRIVNDGSANYAYVSQVSAGWTASHYGRVRLTFMVSVPSAVITFLLRRSDGSDYNFATGAWVGGSPGLWTSPLASGTILDSDAAALLAGATQNDTLVEWQSPVFAAGGTYSMTLYVGLMAGANSAGSLMYAQLVRSTAPRCPAWQVIPTVGASITCVEDSVYLDNSTACRFLKEDRGQVELRWRPSFNHADLANSAYVFLFVSYRHGVATANEYDGLWYRRTDASNGKWVYQRSIGGTVSVAEYAVSGANLMAAGTEYRLAARWTGTHRELGLSPYTMDLFVDGAKRATAVSGAPGAANNSALVCLGRNASGSAGDFGGGWYSRLVCQTFCKTDGEILRGMVV
jgi:hypothetical protein